MYTVLRQRVESQKDRVVDLSQKLIATASPSFKESRIAGLIKTELEQHGFDKVVEDPAGNVIGLFFGSSGSESVILLSHMDTFGQSYFEKPKCKIENGRIYGPGAADCKCGIASQIYAAVHAKKYWSSLSGNIVVAATVGGERGCGYGVKTLIEKTLPELGVTPVYAVMSEPTDLKLNYGHDGWVDIEVVVSGYDLVGIRESIEAIYNDMRKFRGQAVYDKQGRSDISVPMLPVEAGARQAVIRLRRPVNENENIPQILKQVEHEAKLASQMKGFVSISARIRTEKHISTTGHEVEIERVCLPWSENPFGKLMESARQGLLTAGCELVCGKWQIERFGIGTAGGMLTKNYGIQAIGYGSGNEELAHQPNEYVEIKKLTESVYGTAAIIGSLIGYPVFGIKRA